MSNGGENTCECDEEGYCDRHYQEELNYWRQKFEAGDIDTEYADYIMAKGDPTEKLICNGDSLIGAMEEGYLLDDFLESRIK
jgi:hypothetical protein